MADDRQVYTSQVYLDRAVAENPMMLALARADLRKRVDRYTDEHGWDIVRVREETDPPEVSFDRVLLRLEVVLIPRTDGEWPAIRAAIEQDETDRQAARADRHRINDRLDALRETVDLWGDRELNGRWRPPERPEDRVPRRPTLLDQPTTTDSSLLCVCGGWCDSCDGCS